MNNKPKDLARQFTSEFVAAARDPEWETPRQYHLLKAWNAKLKASPAVVSAGLIRTLSSIALDEKNLHDSSIREGAQKALSSALVAQPQYAGQIARQALAALQSGDESRVASGWGTYAALAKAGIEIPGAIVDQARATNDYGISDEYERQSQFDMVRFSGDVLKAVDARTPGRPSVSSQKPSTDRPCPI